MRLLLDAEIARDLMKTSNLSMADYDVLSVLADAPGQRERLAVLAGRMLWSKKRDARRRRFAILFERHARRLGRKEPHPRSTCLAGSTWSLIASRWQQCLLAPDEMCAVPGLLRRRTLEVAVSDQSGFPDRTAGLNLDVGWIHGSEAAKYNTDPDIQVHACDEHTYILRQNMAVHYEAPFMFLLFGGSRAVLLDTGATANPQFFPLRRTVDLIIDGWLARHPHPDNYGLLVLHTHSHTDHTAADGQFADRPDTVVIGAKRNDAWPYFGFADQPESVIQVDLGSRILDCLGTPGHHEAAVTYYDRYSGILFTGDTIYPGRLYVFDWTSFVRSIDRLVDWCAERPVTYLIGCHIEMTTKPGVDYPVGSTYQPDETPLQLTTDHLKQIQSTLKDHNLQPDRYVLPQMIITPIG